MAESSINVEEVIKFVDKLVKELGVTTNYEMHANHTTHGMKVDGVGEFKFHYEDGQTMFGGTSYDIYHRGQLVLSTYEGKIETYKEGDWVKTLNHMMDNSKRVIANYKKRHPELSQIRKSDEAKMEKENEDATKFYSEALRYKMEHPEQFPLWFM